MYRVLLLVFVKFADFNGRISRRDFCISTGLCLAVTVLVASISHLFGLEEWWFLRAWIGMLLLEGCMTWGGRDGGSYRCWLPSYSLII